MIGLLLLALFLAPNFSLIRAGDFCDEPPKNVDLDTCCPGRPEVIPLDVERECVKEFETLDDPAVFLCMANTCVMRRLNLTTNDKIDQQKILKLVESNPNITGHWKDAYLSSISYCFPYMRENGMKISQLYKEAGIDFELDICNPEHILFGGCTDIKLFNSCDRVTNATGCADWEKYYRECPVERILGLA